MRPAPWTDAAWLADAEQRMHSELGAIGRSTTGPAKLIKSWGRSCVHTVETRDGTVWIKHGYGLPPGEETVLRLLSRRWASRLPQVVASWPGAVAMEPLGGRELESVDAAEDWMAAARAIAEIEAGEASHVATWIELGVRDRRPHRWGEQLDALAKGPACDGMDPELRDRFRALVPELTRRYVDAFTDRGTLIHQDSGCCNIHITARGPVIFDWADVVIGHPAFSCDRLLDQVPRKLQPRVIEAFLEPLGLDEARFKELRRSNVLHEVLRYHDELAYLAPEDPTHESLTRSVRSQIRRLVEREARPA